MQNSKSEALLTAGISQIKTTKVVYPQVYSYILPDEQQNEGSQKIGYTERKNVDTRIHEQTHTAAKHLNSEKLWSAPAFFAGDQVDFKDTDFHKFLVKSDIQHRPDLGKEWYYFNGTPEKSKQLFDKFRQYDFAELQKSAEFLWNAAIRF
jgi:type II restriction enzyme